MRQKVRRMGSQVARLRVRNFIRAYSFENRLFYLKAKMKVLKRVKKCIRTLLVSSSLILALLFLFNIENVFGEVKVAVLDSGCSIDVDQSISFTSLPVNFDPLDHGTHIVEAIRQENPQALIYVVQICDKKGSGYEADVNAVIQGIQWAREQKVDIINLSLVLEENDQLRSLIDKVCLLDGIIVIAAAGNKSFMSRFAFDSGFVTKRTDENFDAVRFPGNVESVISVGALDAKGAIASYSVKGADIYFDGTFKHKYGTSFAAAKVTGHISKIMPSTNNLPSKSELISALHENAPAI